MVIDCYKDSELFTIPIDAILYAESYDDDLFINTSSDTYKVRMRLYEFESQFHKNGFIRIHKSYVVNIIKVKKILPLFNSKLKLILLNKNVLYVTRTYLKSFNHYLKTGGAYNDH